MKRVFVSEDKIKHDKKVRNDEIEEHRNKGIEIKEEEYDSRPLYERLQEQKKKKEVELEEKFKTASLMSYVDNEDAKFIQKLNSDKLNKVALERQREIEESELFKKSIINKRKNLQEQSKPETKNDLTSIEIDKEFLKDKIKEIEKRKKLFEGIKKNSKKESPKMALINYSDSE